MLPSTILRVWRSRTLSSVMRDTGDAAQFEPPTDPKGADARGGRVPMSAGTRVLALDLLRGLCAVVVVVYHSLAWLEFGTFYNWGLYGVYIFFVISGASLTIAYSDRLRDGASVARYMALRYLRLAPLYVGVAGCVLAIAAAYGRLDGELLGKAFLNATLLFGFTNPGETSIVTGGWSLGIEFVFYCAFPVMVSVARTRWHFVVTLLACSVQLVFVNYALAGPGTFAEHWARYTQFASFVGYFAAGIWIGHRLLDDRRVRLSEPVGLMVACAVAAMLLVAHGSDAIASLTGVRGAVLGCCAIVLVSVVSDLRLKARGAWLAETLGDASYALYLLHPLVYAVLGSRRLLGEAAAAHPLPFTALLLAVSFVLALFVHRKIERPILRRLRAALA